MTYNELVEGLAEITDQPVEVVKDILYSLPDVLLDLKEGEKILTPLGVFYMYKTKSRPVTMPNQIDQAMTHATYMVKLKPGIRLKLPV